MRICATSDLHGFLPGYLPKGTPPWCAELHRQRFEIKACDILLVAGDICPVWDHAIEAQIAHLDGPFREWLEVVPARHVVGVAGNHDHIFHRHPEMVPAGLRWHYLQDSMIELEGLRIYGSPWQPFFCNWSFNLTEPELAEKWAMIPDQVDILVLHGPPMGWGDRANDGRGCGSPSLRQRILEIKPRLTVFGHAHEGYGEYPQEWGSMANVSIRNRDYDVINGPMYFELPDPRSSD